MLAADKQALQRELSQHILELQWKELQYLYQNAQHLGTTSAVLVGFSFASSGVIGVLAYTSENNIWWRFEWTATRHAAVAVEGFLGLTLALAMSFGVIALFTTTVTCMAGPGLALRGPEGSVERAVRLMERHNKEALRNVGRAIFAFTLHLVALGVRSCFTVSVVDGAAAIVIGGFTFRKLQHVGCSLADSFYVSEGEFVRGTFSQRAGEGEDSAGASDCKEESDQRRPAYVRWLSLWKLDELLVFPWQLSSEKQPVSARPDHQRQVRDLLLRMQGGVPVATRETTLDAIERMAALGALDNPPVSPHAAPPTTPSRELAHALAQRMGGAWSEAEAAGNGKTVTFCTEPTASLFRGGAPSSAGEEEEERGGALGASSSVVGPENC
ncbi:hypothetical protein AB1Y20_014693 [Prymnesium parvum]|uniref:Uncharacterized protein n=1 Tax=Prymnesium parvum TaxID=97485 RepID=A0AB34ID05_PRYPA